MTRIKVTCNWETSEKITKRLIEQFLISDNDIKDMSFVYDDSYDIMIIFGYVTEVATKNRMMYLFPQEPSWNGIHQKNFQNIDNINVFGFEKSIYEPQNYVIETISHGFYGGTGTDPEFWNYKNLKSCNFTKYKKISSLVSQRGIDHLNFHENCLYPQRIALLKNLTNTVDFIDFYGWGDNNKNLKEYVIKNIDALRDYKFVLAIENAHEKYFITERFYDAILSNTIPIYFGCTNIKEFWPENGYILLDNITDYEYVQNKLKWIYDNIDELYNQMIPELLKIKNRYFNEEFNLIKKIKKLI
jgi:hypothetical protein